MQKSLALQLKEIAEQALQVWEPVVDVGVQIARDIAQVEGGHLHVGGFGGAANPIFQPGAQEDQMIISDPVLLENHIVPV